MTKDVSVLAAAAAASPPSTKILRLILVMREWWCVLVVGSQQHVYGAAADGQLTHWRWDPSTGVQRQNWGGDVATG